jgi:hypothetical protein
MGRRNSADKIVAFTPLQRRNGCDAGLFRDEPFGCEHELPEIIASPPLSEKSWGEEANLVSKRPLNLFY